jgi:hypothetical protein
VGAVDDTVLDVDHQQCGVRAVWQGGHPASLSGLIELPSTEPIPMPTLNAARYDRHR